MNFNNFIKSIFKNDRNAGLRYKKQNPFKFKTPKVQQDRVGVTRKDKKQSKARRKMAARSRRINRKKS